MRQITDERELLCNLIRKITLNREKYSRTRRTAKKKQFRNNDQQLILILLGIRFGEGQARQLLRTSTERRPL